MTILPQGRQSAEVIDFPRPAMEATPQKPRGGRREPLPRLTIVIPNYGKYQHTINGRKEWVALYGAMRHSRQVRRLEQGQRWSFCVLLMIADNDGKVIETTARELAFEFGCDNHRTAQRAIDAMVESGLIQVEIKSVSSQVQVKVKSEASQVQVRSKSPELEQSANDAGQSTPTTDNGQLTIEIPPNPQGGTEGSGASHGKKKRTSITFADLTDDERAGFEEFFVPFPNYNGRKVRATAQDAWVKVCRPTAKKKAAGAKPWSPEQQTAIMTALRSQMAAHQASRSFEREGWNGFPGPAPWLNQMRWTAETDGMSPDQNQGNGHQGPSQAHLDLLAEMGINPYAS